MFGPQGPIGWLCFAGAVWSTEPAAAAERVDQGVDEGVGVSQAVPSGPAIAPTAARPEPDPDDARKAKRERPEVPDLGVIRYRDPDVRRTVLLGAEFGGAVVPESFGLFNRTVWTVGMNGSWAVALTPWLAAGGRHGIAWYDAQNVRLRAHGHTLDLSGRPMYRSRLRRPHFGDRVRDRLALTFEFHAIRTSTADDFTARLGGVIDAVLGLGYGMSHRLARKFRLDWNVQGRHVWVLLDTQRHLRASVRAVVLPRGGHQVGIEAVGFLVHRNEDQAGNPVPRVSALGQFALQYDWMSKVGVGPMVRARFNTSFLSGQAPVYEVREESLNAPYGDLTIGLRAVWK